MEFTTQNGNKTVIINEADWKTAINLKNAAFKCLLSLEAFKDLDLNALKDTDMSKLFDSVFQLLVKIDTSDEFDKAIFACLANCLYDNLKITEQLFNDIPTAREDYYEIVAKCVELNLRPFFKSLVSALKQGLAKVTTE